MRKKGQMTLQQVLGLALGIFVVFVVAWFIVAPDKLFAAATAAGFSFGLGELPEDRAEGFSGGSTVPKEMRDYFDILSKKFANSPNLYKEQEQCLISVDKFKTEGSYKIQLSSERIRILKFGIGTATTEFDKALPGFEPCIISGEYANVFVNNWLTGNNIILEEPFIDNLVPVTLELGSNENLKINNVDSKVLRKKRHYVYLYKADDKHFCFIQTHDGGSCNVDGGTLEKGCRDNILSRDTPLEKCENLRSRGEATSNIPVGARILHVKIDPFDDPVETWAFHLTDDKDHHMEDVDSTYRKFVDEIAGKKMCNVFSVNEEGGDLDHLSTWYIAPGGRLMNSMEDNIHTLYGGIKEKILGVEQDFNNKKGSPFPSSTGATQSDPEAVGNQRYSISTDNDECGSDGHSCGLLTKFGDDHAFSIENELLCDDKGYWRKCESKFEGHTVLADGNNYECKEGLSSWIWR